jgi:Fur family transcriptional regulator, ferric uptake regulator
MAMMTRERDHIFTMLREHGERLTTTRQAVIAALCELGGHQTMQALQSHLGDHGMHMPESTIYRVLQWLKDLGLVAQTDLGQSGITYEIVSTPRHHHLVCLACGAMQDVDDGLLMPLRAALHDAYGFLPRIDHMAFFGLCAACQEKGALPDAG